MGMDPGQARGDIGARSGRVRVGPDVNRVFGAGAVAGQGLGVFAPQVLHAGAELLQALELVRLKWLH